jgi:hypothetical protein
VKLENRNDKEPDMSIPKKISYCWFGGNPLPEKITKCIESWKKYCPDYEIIRWDETNYDVNKIPFVRDAYKEKKWAFVSDYARLDIIYNQGGIYLDTDVELVKNIDFLLEDEAFFAIEKGNANIATGLGFGAEAGNAIVKENMQVYEEASFYKEDGSLNLKACPVITTELMEAKGYVREDKLQKVAGAVIYPSEYFCPMDFAGNMKKTENTVGIHWYDATWLSASDRKIHSVELQIGQKYPPKVAKMLCKIYRNGYRFCEYLKNGVLIEKIIRKIKRED